MNIFHGIYNSGIFLLCLFMFLQNIKQTLHKNHVRCLNRTLIKPYALKQVDFRRHWNYLKMKLELKMKALQIPFNQQLY
jgi:hypothetical protein